MKTIRLLFGLAASALIASGLHGASTHEVTVFSSITVEGKKLSLPTADAPLMCILANGGNRNIGGFDPAVTATPVQTILSLVSRALTRNSFRCGRPDEGAPSLMIVCHWGHATPPAMDAGPEFNGDRAEMLALVGGAALGRALDQERAAIVTAANDERFFVIVSAYDYAAYSNSGAKRLLWRSQMSVPSYGLSTTQAWPLLTAAGAALFGRETPLPRRIAVEVGGVLNPEVARK
jgi:hypothetical protein